MESQIIIIKDLLEVDPNISVVLKRDNLKEMRALIKSKFGSVEKFSKIMGLWSSTLSEWLNGNRNPKLKIVIRICKLLNIKLEDVAEKVICLNEPTRSYIPITAFPIKKDANLVSLVGHSLGDGHVGISFEYTNKCEDLLNEVNKSVRNSPIRNVKVIFNRQPNKTPTLVFPKMVRSVLVCAGSAIGNKIISNFGLPVWIKNGDKEIKSAFIRALFDDEANVSNSRVIRFSLSKRIDSIDNLHVFFKEIEQILEDLGLNGIKIKKGKENNGKNGKTVEMKLAIFGFFNFKRFSEVINFNHPRKKKLLQKLTEPPKVLILRKGETKKKIIDLLENDSLTISEISKLIGFSWKTIWEHLKELESKNLVTKIKPDNSRESLWCADRRKIT